MPHFSNFTFYRFCRRALFFVVISALLWQANRYPAAVAQDDDSFGKNRIYITGLDLINISWANDSSRFVFQEEGDNNGFYTEGRNSWHEYSIATRQMTTSEIWPLRIEVTTEQWETFEIYPPARINRTFLFASPDERYIVYKGARTDHARPIVLPFGVADLENEQYIVMDEWLVFNSAIFRRPTIVFNYTQWSPDSQFFTISTTDPPPGDIYFVDISQGIHNLAVFPLRQNVIINDVEFDVHFMLDIVGDNVLLSGGYRGNRSMAVWNPIVSTGYEIEVVGEIAGGKIYGDDISQVWFVDAEGLKQYDHLTGEVTLINPAITSTWAAGGAYFSPNGDHLAIYDGGRNGPNRIYLFELDNLPQ